MKEIFELSSGDTVVSDVQGSSFTAYGLTPSVWLKEIIDAAKKKHYLVQALYETEAAPGQKDVVIPYRKKYLGSSDWASVASEGQAVNYTKLNNFEGKVLTPVDKSWGVAISNRAVRVSAIDVVKQAQQELIYRAGDVVDKEAFEALTSKTNQATSTSAGAQWLYGGDARLDSELSNGDVLTTDMIAEAREMLMSTTCKYWDTTSAGDIQTSAEEKNPWEPEDNEPFVLYISPAQYTALLKDSQFVNAAEYGDSEVIKTGRIARYLGIEIVVSNNVPRYTTSDSCPDGSSGHPGTVMNRCMLIKARKAGAIAWGQRPRLHVFPYESELETRCVLEMAYAIGTLYKDAIVYLDVAEK